jgi:hypothetical protein
MAVIGLRQITLWVNAKEYDTARAEGMVPTVVFVTREGVKVRSPCGKNGIQQEAGDNAHA